MVTIDEVLNLITEQLITSEFVTPDVVYQNQRSVEAGVFKVGVKGSSRLSVFSDKL